MRGRDIVVVGASAGGIEALGQLVGNLPADFPAAVFVVVSLVRKILLDGRVVKTEVREE